MYTISHIFFHYYASIPIPFATYTPQVIKHICFFTLYQKYFNNTRDFNGPVIFPFWAA